MPVRDDATMASAEEQSRRLDNSTRVMTPEHIMFEYQLAGPFRRILAYMADILISIVGFALLLFAVWMIFVLAIAPFFVSAGMRSFVDELAGMMGFVSLVSWFVIYWFYGAVAETYLNGQTFGKRFYNLRVMTVDGHSIDGVQATLRNFFRLLDMAPLASLSIMFGYLDDQSAVMIPTCLIGMIAMLISPRYQRLGDVVAGTMVIHEEPRRLASIETFQDQRVASLAEWIPANFVVSSKLARALSDYVDGRRLLAPQRAAEIANHVAQPLMQKFQIAADTDPDLFLCALYYRTFVNEVDDDQPDRSGIESLPTNVETPELTAAQSGEVE